MEDAEYQRSISDYAHIFWRRKFYLLITIFLILTIGVSVVFLLPAKYQSTATILIESQQIPTDLIRSTITSYADERIEVIKQKVLITNKTSEIIDKYKLYKKEQQKMTTSALTDLFRKNVEIKMISANRGRRGQRGSIAFTLSFIDINPNVAQVVANELVTLFLDENVKARTMRAEETTDFLADEANKIKKTIGDIESSLSEFKSKNSEALPEFMQLNLSMMERYETAYQSNLGKIEAIKGKISFLESELRLMSSGVTENGVVVSGSADKVAALEEKLIELKSSYSSKHPNIIKLQTQIEQLKNSDVSGDPELIKVQNEYSELLSKYSKKHPSVINKKSELEKLKASSKVSAASPQKPSKRVKDASYINVSAQISAARSELKQLVRATKLLQTKLNDTEKRLLKAPEVEKAYKDLLRDYDNMQDKYREIKNKELEARISQNLETEKKGERFTLLEPALFPDKATKPNRPMLLLLVIGAAGFLGIVVVFAVESLNPAVRGEREVENVIGELPLIIIPYIETDEDITKKKRRIKLVAALLLGVVFIALLLVHFFFMQLDVFWYALLRKIGEF